MKEPETMPFKKPENEQDDLIADQAMAWFSRLQSESVSAEEKMQFLNWKAQSPLHKNAYDEITMFWDDAEFNQALTEATLSIDLKQSNNKSTSNTRSYWLSGAMAACLALFVVLFEPITYIQADYQTAIGVQRLIHLSDGSSVTLNTDSALAVDFNDSERRVRLLKGEAFFAVNSDKHKPFIIDSGETETRVLGTKFIVKNKPTGDKVTVVEGLVKVSSLQHDQFVLLHREQQVDNSDLGLEEVISISVKDETAWLTNRLIYNDKPLSEVISDLERYLPGAIFIKDSQLKRYKINARLDISDPDAALDTLQQTLPITITHLSPWVKIISKKQNGY